MRFDPLMRVEAWTALGVKIARYSDASSWWLGDWLAFGQIKYGRRYKEGIAATGLDYQTLRNYAVVARRFGLSRRRDNLSFQHHSELCALGDDDQDLWLDLAAENGWSKSELRRRLRGVGQRRPSGVAPRPRSARWTLQLVLEPQREQNWRKAAERSQRPLEAWITQVLDAAAGVVQNGDAHTSNDGAWIAAQGGGRTDIERTGTRPSPPAARASLGHALLPVVDRLPPWNR
jgi:hypothetical protein